jgi:precorrin-6A/cobalt-precorrin-6A reductase
MHVLILGGTAEARLLGTVLAQRPGLRVTTSLAGRVATPTIHAGELRIGGFGGAEGLAGWLRAHDVDALVDATHPFAEVISRNAASAASDAHVPLLAVRRPGWVQGPQDDWRNVGSLDEAAAQLPGIGTRIFLSTGRKSLATFAALDDLWFLIRSVDPPQPPVPRQARVLLARGPFTVQDEVALLRAHQIDVVVTRDSGGDATAAKLAAARTLGIPVVVIRRPPLPGGVPVVEDSAGAVEWLSRFRSLDPASGEEDRCP